jgi:hypothetical protein
MKHLIFILFLALASVAGAQTLPDSIRVTLVDSTYIVELISLDEGPPRLPEQITIVRAQGQGEFLNFLRGTTLQAYVNYYQAVLRLRQAQRAAAETMRGANNLRPEGTDAFFMWSAGQFGKSIEGTYTLASPQAPNGVGITINNTLRFSAGGTTYQVRVLAPGALRILVQSSGAFVADVFFVPGTRRYVSLDDTYRLTVNTLANGQ